MVEPDKPQDLQAKLAQLRLAYQRSLPGKQRDIRAQWRAVKKTPEDTLAWQALQVSVHQLAGSAGSYGFPALGEAAQSLDADIRSFLHDPDLDPGQGLSQHRIRVERLDRLLLEAVESALT